MLGDVESEGVVPPRLAELRAAILAAKAWQEQARRSQSRSTRGVAARATLNELRAMLAEGRDLRLDVAEVGVLALQVCRDRGVLMISARFTYDLGELY
jgi:hypothetical protein